MYQPTVARWSSADAAGFVDGLNIYSYGLSQSVTLTDSGGKEVDLAIAPEDPVGMKFYVADFADNRVLGNTCRDFDLNVFCRPCIDNCQAGRAPRHAYIFLHQSIIIDLDNIDALGMDYKGTYGHEQLHVANGIKRAKELKEELDNYLAHTKCITGDPELAELKCELEASEIAIKFIDKWNAWAKLDSEHRLGAPKKGMDHPPMGGKVGKTASLTSQIEECVQKVNDVRPNPVKLMNCLGGR